MTREPREILNDIVDAMKELEDAINTLESDSTYGQIDEGSLRNINLAGKWSNRISGLLSSISRYIAQKKKEEENRYKIDYVYDRETRSSRYEEDY